ncbi:hypothetical protein QTO34_015005 [Cnephaeus nilssonii]|uniref:Uncharacterized protein n=1 Tax=Cnephaeus nilssonii TaxID=3371016 RepID=A0AA40I3E8_CNENI|nr:hypothetical protein QTO34_015005 [Eptesicus nilssonii]
MRLEDEYQLHQKASPVEDSMDEWLQKFPTAWAETGGVGLGAHRAPVLGDLKPGEGPEARKGIQPNIRRLRGIGVLVPCQSAWNTPLLPVKEPHTNDYQPVQDLQEVNKRVMDIHPMVPNPYTLLSSLAPSRVWYTVLDLKDAFFSLPLAPRSQPLFAFEWHDLEEGYSGLLTWTRLPQGFKNSPTIFDEALHEDLGEYRRTHPNLTLLQYVDDILIAADTAEDCKQGTRDLLASLGALGYWTSAKKAQICRERVSYLGYILEGGQRQLSDARKETMLKIPTPTSRREDGSRYAGAAVVTETDTVWAKALPSGTSAQRADLVALTKALTLGVGRRLNIYTDSRYAFATAHVHGAIYHERGLLTAEGQTIKNKQEILNLLSALWLPTKLAIIHCQGHQKADDPVARGNRRADQTAKAVALSPIPTMALQLPDPGDPVLPVQPGYSLEELQRIRKLSQAQEEKGWWYTPQGELILPDQLGVSMIKHMHRSTHLGARKLKDLIRHARIKIHQQDIKIE